MATTGQNDLTTIYFTSNKHIFWPRATALVETTPTASTATVEVKGA